MRLRIFRLLTLRVNDERYEELTEHGCHPSNAEVKTLYSKGQLVNINIRMGDIFEVDGRRYFYAPSGIEVYEPIT